MSWMLTASGPAPGPATRGPGAQPAPGAQKPSGPAPGTGKVSLSVDEVARPELRRGHVLAEPLCVQRSVTQAQLAFGIPTLAYERIKRPPKNTFPTKKRDGISPPGSVKHKITVTREAPPAAGTP